jgi:hypothetical protein
MIRLIVDNCHPTGRPPLSLQQWQLALSPCRIYRVSMRGRRTIRAVDAHLSRQSIHPCTRPAFRATQFKFLQRNKWIGLVFGIQRLPPNTRDSSIRLPLNSFFLFWWNRFVHSWCTATYHSCFYFNKGTSLCTFANTWHYRPLNSTLHQEIRHRITPRLDIGYTCMQPSRWRALESTTRKNGPP